MNDRSIDWLDEGEPAVARRVHAFSEQAVGWVDAAVVSNAAIEIGRRSRGRGWLRGLPGVAAPTGRLAWVGVVGLLAIVGGFGVSGGLGRLLPNATIPGTLVVPDAVWCTPEEVDASISLVEAVDSGRVVFADLRHIGMRPCSVFRTPEVELTDGTGNTLVVAPAPSPVEPIEIEPGDLLVTRVDVDSYCGPDPEGRFSTLVFIQRLPESGAPAYVATPLTPADGTILPGCVSGTPNDQIRMQGWARTQNLPGTSGGAGSFLPTSPEGSVAR